MTMINLDCLFKPESVAVAGISPDPGKWSGGIWIKTLIQLGFAGRIYPVSKSMTEYEGLRVYPDIERVPDNIDLIVICIPARFTPQLMAQCVHKHVKFAQFFTAGFSEVDGHGAALEREVIEIAGRGGLRIVGPNCMGVYCPESRFSWRADFPPEPGVIAFSSQSGTSAVQMVRLAAARGLHFSKVISYGNGADLNEVDFLEYFLADDKSRVIAAYIEGVKDGRRLFQTLRRASQVKPVIVLKAGRSPAGARGALSHTGSMAGSSLVWESMIRQAGAISVGNFEELTDAALAFSCLSSVKGKGVALIGCGGGTGIIGADECEEVGLTLPSLPENAIQALSQFIPREGTGIHNPIDLPWGQTLQQFRETLAIIGSCPDISSLIVHYEVDIFWHIFGGRELEKMIEALISAARDCTKPVIAVLVTSGFPEAASAIQAQQHILLKAGIPVYPTVRRAAWVVSQVSQHRHFPRF
jgi:acyl-CoA synthetase (NDP forming)